MPSFVQSFATDVSAITWTGGGTNYIVETAAGVIYVVYVDTNSDVAFTKSTDGGKTWAAGTVIFTGTTTQLSVWYDRWSGISAGLIHCAYSEAVTDDVFYRTIDTEAADALGTQRTIFAGDSTSGTTSTMSITRTRGGNLLCCGTIDGGTENFARKSTDVGVNWTDIASPMESEANDTIILVPGFAADNQDALAIFCDASASEISRKVYDDSGNSWAESSIATSITALSPGTAFANMSVAVDLANSQLVLVAWTASDLANADLRCWTVTEAAITETSANVVLNSTDDQSLCAISIDTTNGDWYVFYGGLSAGTQTVHTILGVYYKVSTDDGATWGSETRLSASVQSVTMLMTNPRMVYLSAEIIAALLSSATTPNFLSVCSVMPTIPAVADVESGVQYGINGVQYTGTLAAGGLLGANLRGNMQ